MLTCRLTLSNRSIVFGVIGPLTTGVIQPSESSGRHYPSKHQAGSFYGNFLHGLHTARDGTLTVFYTRTSEKSPMTAAEDIGTEAVELLTGPVWTGRRATKLGSMVSPDEVATQLGSVLGREVRAQALPREAWVSTLEQMGFPSGQTWAFEEIYDGVNSTELVLGSRVRNAWRERPPLATSSLQPNEGQKQHVETVRSSSEFVAWKIGTPDSPNDQHQISRPPPSIDRICPVTYAFCIRYT